MEANTACETETSGQSVPHKVEQRQYARQLTRIEVEIAFDGVQALHALAENTSLSGAWVALSTNQPAIGAVGKLHAKIGSLNLYMMAKVVRKNSIGIGVSFIDMGFDTYDKLKDIMRNIEDEPAETKSSF